MLDEDQLATGPEHAADLGKRARRITDAAQRVRDDGAVERAIAERQRLRRRFDEHPDGRAIYERSVAASDNMRAMAEARVDVLLAQPADPAVRGEVVETMARIDPAAFRIGAEAVWLADQVDRAAAVRVATLILCGMEDKVTPPPLSHELSQLISGARYEPIERAGHLTNLEQSEAFNALVESFIGEVESRP